MSHYQSRQKTDRSSRYLQHKVSSLSDDPSDAETPSILRGHESLVSIPSQYGSPPLGWEHDDMNHNYPGGSSWSAPFVRQPSTRYKPVLGTISQSSNPDRRKTSQASPDGILVEDETYDMSLLPAAAPMGSSNPYSPAPDREPEDAVFDVTTFSGPMGAQDEEFLRKLQEQEASGKLTGGLGAGMSRTTIRSDHLMASSPTVNRSFSRTFSMRRKRASSQRDVVRGLGQKAADSKGEVIEVIMEEQGGVIPITSSQVDLSNMTGPKSVGSDLDLTNRRVPTTSSKTEVFYPHPNWKPFSMRWPYLVSMIVVSLGLATGQELLYRQSAKQPLLQFTDPKDITPFDYFMLKFVPTFITVGYGVLWQITDFEVRRLEAFYQMSKEGGALAAESINVDHITAFNFFRPLWALYRRHYAVAVSSVATLLGVSLVPTLGTAAIILSPDRTVRTTHPDVEKYITIQPVLSRLLTSTFVICAVLGGVLLYQLQTRRSGLLADVKGIAGLASMAVVSHIMMDFKDLDVARPKDIHHRLKNHRYILRNSSLAPDDETPVSLAETDRYKEAHLSENPHPLMLRAAGAIPFIAGIVLFLGFIFLFLSTPVSVVTDKAPWLVTALAVCIRLGWGSFETDIRMMEPYYILSKRHAPAKVLTLDYTAMPFGWVAIRAAFNRHWTIFLVGFGSVLAEMLTIFVTSLALVDAKIFINAKVFDSNPSNDDKELNSGQETPRSIAVSLALTVFILLYLFIVALVVFVRRRHPFLPRQPNTIASVLAFMHQSKMLYDFVGTTRFSSTEMVRWLERQGKTYGLGWYKGRDGKEHCGVDWEELMGSYKHGIDYSKGGTPWNEDWATF